MSAGRGSWVLPLNVFGSTRGENAQLRQPACSGMCEQMCFFLACGSKRRLAFLS